MQDSGGTPATFAVPPAKEPRPENPLGQVTYTHWDTDGSVSFTVRVPPVGFFGVAGRGVELDRGFEPLFGFDLGFDFGCSSGGSPVSATCAGRVFFGGVLPRFATPSEEAGRVATGLSLSSGMRKKANNTAEKTSTSRPVTTT